MRPISPHLTIYKKQISSVLSAFHRISGAALFCAMSGLVWWFILMIFSGFKPCLVNLFECKLMQLGLFATSVAAFYHLCTGLRHLFWDMGLGFAVPTVNKTGWIAVFSWIGLTIIFWLFII